MTKEHEDRLGKMSCGKIDIKAISELSPKLEEMTARWKKHILEIYRDTIDNAHFILEEES